MAFSIASCSRRHCKRLRHNSGYPLQLHRHEGYDHSYYFVASFIEAQLRFHAAHLARA